MGDYTIQQVLEMRMSQVDSALTRIEAKVDYQGQRTDALASEVSTLRVENAKSAGKWAMLMVLLTGASGAVGAILAANILSGGPK